jgi:glycosyltransferase involved in cell wall biosynthesis
MILNSEKSSKILFVTRVFPIENSTGARAYVLDILKFLKGKGFEIEIAMVDSSIGGRSPVFIIPKSVLKLAQVSFKDHFRLGRILMRNSSLVDFLLIPVGLVYYLLPEINRDKIVDWMERVTKKLLSLRNRQRVETGPITVVKDELADLDEIEMVKRRIEVFRPDVIIANYAWLTGVFDVVTNEQSILKMVLTHDVIHQRAAIAQKENFIWSTSEWTSDKEAALLRKTDVVIAIQKEEADVFKNMNLIGEVICAPISASPQNPKSIQVPGRCLFVGSKGAANVHGLIWFLKKVWPMVLIDSPNSQIRVCGTVCSKIDETFPNTRFLGRVDSLDIEYAAAEVCLIPVHFGSGLKIKLIEALSYGRACVSTTIGIQGMAELKNNAVMVADTSDRFASSVHTILSDSVRRQKMEKEAHRFITEKLSPEIAYQAIINRIDDHLFGWKKNRT